MTEKDILSISTYVGEDPEIFMEKFCQISGGRPVLAIGHDGKCIFFDQNCTIHPVKPKMCKAWPFIEGVLREPDNWDLMANSCPGILTGAPTERICKCVSDEIMKLKALRTDLD